MRSVRQLYFVSIKLFAQGDAFSAEAIYKLFEVGFFDKLFERTVNTTGKCNNCCLSGNQRRQSFLKNFRKSCHITSHLPGSSLKLLPDYFSSTLHCFSSVLKTVLILLCFFSCGTDLLLSICELILMLF